MMTRFLFTVNIIIILVLRSKAILYNGHSVLRVRPQSSDHIRLLQSIEKGHSNYVKVWRRSSFPSHTVDIQVHPQQLTNISDTLAKHSLAMDTIITDIQQLIESVSGPSLNERPGKAGFNYSVYHTYSEILGWLDDIPNICSEFCQVLTIGKSFEGRQLRLIKIGTSLNSTDEKPTIWIDGGFHSREWIAPATTLYIIKQLVDLTKVTPTHRLVSDFNWFILPLVNPDGYHYTWTTDRLWRKTRSVNLGSACRGADPNRNWNFHWAGRGTSNDPCSENFHGSAAFSEPETRAMALYIWQHRRQISAYFTLHSYGQLWLTPWGFTRRVPHDYNDMVSLGNIGVSAVKKENGSDYKIGSSARILYLASGGSDDWVKGAAGVKYAYTVELGDTGAHGFLLPASHIIPTGCEMMRALEEITREMTRRRRVRRHG